MAKASSNSNVETSGRASQGRGPAMMLLVFVLGLSLVACSRIPNPFSMFADGGQVLAAQRGSRPQPSRVSESIAVQATATVLASPETEPEPTATATVTSPATLISPTLSSLVPTATMTPAGLGTISGTQMALSPTKTPKRGTGSRKGGVRTTFLTPTTSTETPTADVSPTPTPTETPEPDETGAGDLGTGATGDGGPPASPAATATPTETRTPTETPEPPNYGGGGGAPGGAPTPTPFGLSSPTPTAVPGPTETPTAANTATPTSTPQPRATPIPDNTFPAVVIVRLVPDDIQVNAGDEFSLDIMIEPNGQEVTVAQVVLSFDTVNLEAKAAKYDPNSPLLNELVAEDTIDNSQGTVILSSGPKTSSSALPDYTFRLGTVTFEATDWGGATDVRFVRFGESLTLVGLMGINLIDEYVYATINVSLPPTPSPTP